jgi:hypothetical protein
MDNMFNPADFAKKFADALTNTMQNMPGLPSAPEVKFNKNGYEIRTDILKMAKDLVAEDFHAKFHGWEISVERTESGQVCSKVEMPEFPGLDKVLETADKMYAFVNGKNK